MKIFKYQIAVTSHQTIEMPVGAKVLCVQKQGDTPCIWALVEPTLDMVQRRIMVVGTGHAFNGRGLYIGTFQMADGALIWHVFDYGDFDVFRDDQKLWRPTVSEVAS